MRMSVVKTRREWQQFRINLTAGESCRKSPLQLRETATLFLRILIQFDPGVSLPLFASLALPSGLYGFRSQFPQFRPNVLLHPVPHYG
jgi:hypothetical protein